MFLTSLTAEQYGSSYTQTLAMVMLVSETCHSFLVIINFLLKRGSVDNKMASKIYPSEFSDNKVSPPGKP